MGLLTIHRYCRSSYILFSVLHKLYVLCFVNPKYGIITVGKLWNSSGFQSALKFFLILVPSRKRMDPCGRGLQHCVGWSGEGLLLAPSALVRYLPPDRAGIHRRRPAAGRRPEPPVFRQGDILLFLPFRSVVLSARYPCALIPNQLARAVRTRGGNRTRDT